MGRARETTGVTGGVGTGVSAAGCTDVVGTVESCREFRSFLRRVVKTGSTGVGAATGVSMIRVGSVAGGSILIRAGAGPALAASQ